MWIFTLSALLFFCLCRVRKAARRADPLDSLDARLWAGLLESSRKPKKVRYTESTKLAKIRL